MQNKHFVMVHKNEDRDIFINKINYPKTIYHVGDDPQPGDIHTDPRHGIQACLAMWIIDNYDNLPDYVIFSQPNPHDHVHEPLLAIESTLTGKWGSFSYARSINDQYATTWTSLIPIRSVAHKLGCGFHNDNNVRKDLYFFYPGEVIYISKEKILERPKSFYELIIAIDIEDQYTEFLNDSQPSYLNGSINVFHPELEHLSTQEKFNFLSNLPKKPHSYLGYAFESLWFVILADKKLFDTLDKSQACIGNKLYFDTEKTDYDLNFNFSKFPYSANSRQTSINFKLFENDWFDWNCPYYLKWRETLKEKTIWEGQQRGFDGQGLLNFYEQIGYKHISL